jgi:hypothetical protein
MTRILANDHEFHLGNFQMNSFLGFEFLNLFGILNFEFTWDKPTKELHL